MSKFVKNVSLKKGLSPGSLLYTGSKRDHKVRVDYIGYNKSSFKESTVKDTKYISFYSKKGVNWINVNGIHDTTIIDDIGKKFDLHPLVLEDIVTTSQRPKIEIFDDYIFLVLNMIDYNQKEKTVETEQISIVIGKNFVLSFQEKEGDLFNTIRERIRKGKNRVRRSGNDYLAYSLLDTIVDNYFTVLEKIGDDIESIENRIVKSDSNIVDRIHKLKKELIFLRRSVWPLREVISSLQRTDSKIIKKNTGTYIRDVYDHTIQVIDTIETFRDMTSGMIDIYLSSINNKMNEIMKVLTVIATTFIPLTFITGVYGMNFRFMPELDLWWFYPFVWVIIASIGISMVLYFKKRGWV